MLLSTRYLGIFLQSIINAEAPAFLSQHSQKSFCNSPDLQVLFSLDFASNNLFLDKNREEIVLAKTVSSDCDWTES